MVSENEKSLELLQAELLEGFETLRALGKVHTRKDFAKLIEMNYTNLSSAFGGDERYLTPSLITRVTASILTARQERVKEDEIVAITNAKNIPLLPIDSIGGSLTEFNAEGVTPNQCELITSPIKGATMAIRITGDSMYPDFPNGSTLCIKPVDAKVFLEWGCPYVLDTENGVVCKIVQPCEDSEDMIVCESINPLYKPFKVAKKYIRGFYRVLLVMALK